MATEEKTANPPGSLDTERGAPTTDVKSPTNAEKTPYVTPKSSPEDVPFSVFTQGEKWALVVMASAAGFFSPMSANIYFPAIPLLAEDFHVSVSLMNLTVTVYLIFQGVSPMLWAPIADMKGRRPIFLACLLLLSVTCVGLAQVPTNKWWVILILRSIQASGSASTVAICYGVVADIALPAHRGSFLGISGIGMLVAPCIGPVIGGAIAGSLGWRWIFWILGILSGACFVGLLLFLPETLRRVVGNGSTPAPWWDRPLIPIIGPFRLGRKPPAPAEIANTESPGRPRYNPFRFFLQLDVDVMLFANAEVYGVFIAMQASLSLLLQEAYPFLNQTSIGLCFLPMGVGALFSSLMTGRFLDWQYRKDRASWEQERRRLRRMANEDPDAPFTQEDELTFPIERVRLKWAIACSLLVSCVSVGFGWSLDKRASLAIPLILQFLCGIAAVGQMTCFQTLLIDDFPKHGSSTTAINNLVRCLLGAGVASVINPILEGLGTGWTYVLIGALCATFSPIATFFVFRIGPRWRARRARVA